MVSKTPVVNPKSKESTPLWEKPIPPAADEDGGGEKTTNGTPKLVVRKRIENDMDAEADAEAEADADADTVADLTDQVMTAEDSRPPVRPATSLRRKKGISRETSQLLLVLSMMVLGAIVLFTVWCLVNAELVQSYLHSFWDP